MLDSVERHLVSKHLMSTYMSDTVLVARTTEMNEIHTLS